MGSYYEEYKRRLNKIAEKLPAGYLIHYIDHTGERKIATEDQLITELSEYHFSQEKNHALYAPEGAQLRIGGYIKSIDPEDLITIEKRSVLLQILLLEDSYYPAIHIIERDPETGELYELSEEELKEREEAWNRLNETEKENYWKEKEKRWKEKQNEEHNTNAF